MLEFDPTELINVLSTFAENANPEEGGDYMENGLLYCHKCGTPKQCRIEIRGREVIVPCMCRCRQERVEAEERAIKRRELEIRVRRTRSEAFYDRAMFCQTFEHDDNRRPEITQALKRYVEHFPDFVKEGKGLLLYGPSGTGKTFAAACVANALIDDGYSVLMTSLARLINSSSGRGVDKQEYINGLARYKLLVIDDFGTERDTEYAQESVYSIIDARYRSGLPMLITTNLSVRDFLSPPKMHLGRIYSRVIERCYPVEFTGDDRRMEKAQESFRKMKAVLGM